MSDRAPVQRGGTGKPGFLDNAVGLAALGFVSGVLFLVSAWTRCEALIRRRPAGKPAAPANDQ